MKRLLLFLVLFFVSTCPALSQDPTLAASEGYELKQSHLMPALELLVFLAQSDLEEQEALSILEEAEAEFMDGPAAFIQSMTDLRSAMDKAKTIQDPTILGQFRQQLITEFYKMAQSPENANSAYISTLFKKAPVVAYDPQTGVALTQPDLMASLVYLQALNAQGGTQIPDEQMLMAGEEIKSGFSQLDAETQQLMASGTILLTVFQGNMQSMSQEQQANVTSHYRTTVGGPPRLTRGENPEKTAMESLTVEGSKNSSSMLSSIKAAGGSEDYWNTK